MTATASQRFHVRNIDCPSCAAKIERGLKAVDGIEDAVLDFANLTLHVRTRTPERILPTVQKLEPGVKLIPKTSRPAGVEPPPASETFNLKRELCVLGAAAVMFLLLLFFESWFHRPSYFKWEIAIVLAAYLLAGWNVLSGAMNTIRKGAFFDENVLMVIATGGAMAIHAYTEAVGVMIFYKVGEMLQELAVSRSRRSVKALLAARPDRAALLTSEGLQDVAPESVKVDQVIVVKPGEKIPLDGEVLEGKSRVDTSALTGESVPIAAAPGTIVAAGQISQTGALTIRVTRRFEDSSIAKVMELVENATARKAKTEKFITTFARYYTPAVVVIAAGIAFIPPIVTGAAYATWIYRALVLLVISCPCALVVSIPLGYFGGIGRASRQGILIKGSNFIDVLAAVKTVVFDKTGTLTRGVFEVKEVVNLNGFSKARLLEFAAAAEYHSNHPIAVSIVAAFEQNGSKIDPAALFEYTEFSGRGATTRYGGRTVLVGNDSFLHQHSISHPQCEFDSTVAHIAVDGKYAGYILIGDQIRPDATSAIQALKRQGVGHIAMLTGDNQCAAQEVAKRLDMDSFYHDLLPEDKVRIFEQIGENGRPQDKIAFVGDGINDAPVIARADVGLAMGALGSDAAIETADVVLMTDSPLKLAEAVGIARQTRRIVWQNILLAFGVKGIFIVFGALGLASMWEAVFADMGTALLAVANSTRAVR